MSYFSTSVDYSLLLQGSDQLKALHESTKKYRELVGKVVAKILDKKYPKDRQQISIEELLEWEFWPICIIICSKLCIIYYCQNVTMCLQEVSRLGREEVV